MLYRLELRNRSSEAARRLVCLKIHFAHVVRRTCQNDGVRIVGFEKAKMRFKGVSRRSTLVWTGGRRTTLPR
jgi:hypothetical protein